MNSVTDELASVLFGIGAAGLTTRDMTARITRAIVEWALAHGWAVRTEARVDADRPGYVDVIVRRGDMPDLAIEIDSTDKAWSVAKLRHAARAGMQPIWIRWGDDAWAGAFDDVDVIQLPLARRPRRRAADTAQLDLWR